MRPAALVLAFLLSACAEEDGGGLLCRFLSDRAVPAEAERLEVAIFAADDGAELSRRTWELAPLGGFPATLGVERGEATPDRVRLEGRVSVGAVLVAAGAAETEFVDGATRVVDVLLVDRP